MTLTEARQYLAQVTQDPNAVLYHQGYVDEAQRLSKDDAAHSRLEEALTRVMLEGDEIETMGCADALMAIQVRSAHLDTIVAALVSLQPPLRRDAAMRVLGVHRTGLSKKSLDDCDAMFIGYPQTFLRLGLTVLPDAENPRLKVLWKALMSVATTSNDPDELALVARAAAASDHLKELLKTGLKQKSPDVLREVALRSNLGDRILLPLNIEGMDKVLEKSFAACSDPAALTDLVKKAVGAGIVAPLPRWLRQKEPALLQAASAGAGPDERMWFQGALTKI
jgi:hypothetical protein